LTEVVERFPGLLVDGVGGWLVHAETQRNFETDCKRDLTRPDGAFGGHPFDQADGFYE
jgi:hypothetical protein